MAQSGEDLDGIGQGVAAALFCCPTNQRLFTPQEHIAGTFLAKEKRHARRIRTQFLKSLRNGRISGFNSNGKRQIGARVFMRTEHQGFIRQFGNALQGVMQRLDAAFEVAATARAKQHVADENCPQDTKGQMAARMSGKFPDRDVWKAVDVDRTAFLRRMAQFGDACVFGAMYRTSMMLNKLRYAANVIGMVMSQEDANQFEIEPFQCSLDDQRITRIDHHGALPGLQQPKIVVGQSGQAVHHDAGDRNGCRVWHRWQFFRSQGGLYHNPRPE